MLKLGQNWDKIVNYSPPPMLNKDQHPWAWVPWPYMYGTPTTGYLHNKTSLSKKSSSESLFTAKIWQGVNIPYFSLLGQITYRI